MMRRVGLAVRSAWGFTAALLVIVLGSVLLVAELHDREDALRQAHIAANELQQDAGELRVASDAMMAEVLPLDEAAEEIDSELKDLHESVTSLQELSDDPVAPEVERALIALESSLESLLASYQAGQPDTAVRVRAERTVSAFDAFDARVDAADDHYKDSASRSSEVSSIGLWVAMLLAGLAIGGLSWRYERARRAAQRVLEERLSERVAELAEITEQHRRLEAMKYSFIAAVSHELRTPLTSIQMSLEMLDDGYAGDLPAAATEVIAVAARGARRLSRLVEDVIDLERLESGHFPFSPGPHDLQELLLETVESLTPVAETAGIALVLHGTHATVLCDGDRVLQALVNLVGNGIKFSSPGTCVRIEAACHDDEVEVIVRDEGRGIPADQLDAVFDRFHQVDTKAHHRGGGAGLGLTITRHMIEAQGGRIWVESEYGAGTSFHFTVPLVPDLRPEDALSLR